MSAFYFYRVFNYKMLVFSPIFQVQTSESDHATFIDDAEYNMQGLLMEHFLDKVDAGGLLPISCGMISHDICEWEMQRTWEVVCVSGYVEGVFIHDSNFGNYSIEWLPNTVEKLFIVASRQEYVLQTAWLPSESRLIDLRANLLYGTVDLRRLPQKLRFLNLLGNDIEGPINIMHLPAPLRTLSLANNVIIQETLIYGDLPQNLEHIEKWESHKSDPADSIKVHSEERPYTDRSTHAHLLRRSFTLILFFTIRF